MKISSVEKLYCVVSQTQSFKYSLKIVTKFKSPCSYLRSLHCKFSIYSTVHKHLKWFDPAGRTSLALQTISNFTSFHEIICNLGKYLGLGMALCWQDDTVVFFVLYPEIHATFLPSQRLFQSVLWIIRFIVHIIPTESLVKEKNIRAG